MIALTGATGFLGSHLARQLAANGNKVCCLVRKNSSRQKNLHGIDCTVRETEFNSVQSLAVSLEGCTSVIHAMGVINASQEELRTVNIQFTQNLTLACLEKNIQKIILISSVAALMQHGPYGLSKKEGEEIVVKSGIPYLIFRPAYIFGPNDQNNTLLMIRTLKRFPLIPLLGGGTFKIQPVYVEDAVDLISKGIHFSRLNSAYTLAGKEQVSLKTMLEILAGHLGVKRIFLPVPLKPVQALMKIFLAVCPNTRFPAKQILELDKHERFDISETVKDFNFHPRTFAEGAEKMFEDSLCAA